MDPKDRPEHSSIKVSVETGNRILKILDRKPRKPSDKLLQDAVDYQREVVEVQDKEGFRDFLKRSGNKVRD